MKDPNMQAEFADFWDDMAGKPKTTIDPEVAKQVSEKMEENLQDSLKKKSS